MEDRKDYIDALKRERAEISGRQDTPNRTRRLGELDEALARFEDKPAERRIERAVRNK